MTRPNDSSGQDAANWWNQNGKDELEHLEFLQKEMMRAIKKNPNPDMAMPEDEEDMGPPDLPEGDEDMGPPDIPEDDDVALEPTEREMDMQSRMNDRRSNALRRPKMRNRADRMMMGEAGRPMRSEMPRRPMREMPKPSMSKALEAEMELKRAFSPEKRQDLAKEGMALPDGSFPIVTESDLENAIMAFGRAKDKVKAKKHIIKRARALKRTDMIPENWGKKDAKGDMYGSSTGMGTTPMPSKKKKIRYGEKEADMAEMEDDEMTSPMSREELMNRVLKKKKKKPMPEEAMEENPMADEGNESEDY